MHTWILAVVRILYYHLSCSFATCTSLTPIKLPSVPIRMLVLSIQLPSRRLASSHSTVTRNCHEIPYSCLVGGLGRICSHSHGNRRSAASENYDHAIVRLGASHVLFRLARSIIDLLALQLPSTQLPSDNEGPTSPSRFQNLSG